MRFTRFVIRDFKGIKLTELKLDELGQGNIFTLVGLNESGKTTILEAINSFSPDLTAEPIFHKDVFRRVEGIGLVPKHRKDNFTGNVEIEAHLILSDSDKQKIADYLRKEYRLELDLAKLSSILRVVKYFTFDKSDFKREGSTWDINLSAKSVRQKAYKTLRGSSEAWQDAIRFVRKLIPSICYFPSFLFEFPARVYLSHAPEQYEPQNKYYRQIIQDVLDSLERGLTIEEHIVARVEKIENDQAWDIFKFWESDRKQQVDAVMNHLGNEITRSVFTRWNEIFGTTFTKTIKIDWNVDSSLGKPSVYLGFSVQDGTSTFSIAERSLGFRWFFCFLLFTQFRKSRRDAGTLFLLDEPASNLHATAQQQLLESFSAVTEGNNSLIYSTHSHYMINPRWLEGAFIVQNGAIEYDEELSGRHPYERHETEVRAWPYKRFVGENPDKSTYYQPILDALDYTPSVLEHHANTVMVEGKGDFYVFTYFKEIVFGNQAGPIFMPSSGANDLGPLISLYLGWGHSFHVLLDDDKAGRRERDRYIDEWYLDNSTVRTLFDIDHKFAKMRLEDLVSEAGKALVCKDLGVEKLTKKQMGRFFQTLLARKEVFEFDIETRENFRKILAAFEEA